MVKSKLKNVIYDVIQNIMKKEQKEYVTLNEIYHETASYLEIEVTESLKSQIRGRLQECCKQYANFTGDPLFRTRKIRSGDWTINEKSFLEKQTKINQEKYIRIEHNQYLTSNDNWKTVTVNAHMIKDATLEENQDLIYIAKLKHELGNPKAEIIIEELNDIRLLLKELKGIEKLNDGYGTAFEVFAISTLHNIDYQDCIQKYIVHGDMDGKIDAIYYGETEDIYIYQMKLNTIDDEAYLYMRSNYNDCEKGKKPNNGKDLFDFIEKNKVSLDGKRKNYRSVSKNSMKDTNFKPSDIYDKYFKNKLLPCSMNHMMLTIFKPDSPTDKNQYNVSTDGCNNFTFYSKANMLIDALILALGIDPQKCDRSKIDVSSYFSDNVRGVLRKNQKMVYTIINEPHNFMKYNNGINITGEVEDLGNKIRIKNPMINNGQQTVVTLMNENQNLDKITVTVKITNEKDMIIKGKISQYSNEQAPVKAIDMLSLNSYVRQIQSRIYEKTYHDEKYYLEIYSSGEKNYKKIITSIYPSSNIIGLLEFMKLYFSVENKKDLGAWKNSANKQVERTTVHTYFDESKSFKVCQTIAQFTRFIANIENKKDKDDFKSADLAFQYLMCAEDLSIEEAKQVIKSINSKFYYEQMNEKSKLIDIYKSSTIIDKLEEELKHLKQKNS